MRLEYWIAARIGTASMRVTGRKLDIISLVQNCQSVSVGRPIPGAEFHNTQRFSISMRIRAALAGLVLFMATGGVGAVLDQFTHSLRHDVAAVATFWGGLVVLSGGEVVVLFFRITSGPMHYP